MSVKRFDPEDILISTETVSVPMWSNDTDLLESANMETSSNQVAFYKDVYYKSNDTASGDTPEKRVQFAVAYGNKYGSGSEAFMDKDSSDKYETGSGKIVASPSSVVWGQYRTLVLGDENSDFQFGFGKHIEGDTTTYISSSNQIFAISIDRARYKEKLRPGSLELVIDGNTYIDDSTFIESERYLDCGRVYDIVKKVEDGIDYGDKGSYGFLLPDIGIVLLNGDAIDVGQNTDHHWYGDDIKDNALYLIEKIESIRLQSEETVTSNYVFIRARNAEFNYSTNPSNIMSDGELRHSIMINSPQAFITTVGLYNDNNDLLAVAKLSKPLVKDFTKEALIRVKLDY